MAQNKSTAWMPLALGPPTPSSGYSLLLWVTISLAMERATLVREAGQKNSVVVFYCSYPFRALFHLVSAIKDLVNIEDRKPGFSQLSILQLWDCLNHYRSVREAPWQSRSLQGRMGCWKEGSQRVPGLAEQNILAGPLPSSCPAGTPSLSCAGWELRSANNLSQGNGKTYFVCKWISINFQIEFNQITSFSIPYLSLAISLCLLHFVLWAGDCKQELDLNTSARLAGKVAP